MAKEKTYNAAMADQVLLKKVRALEAQNKVIVEAFDMLANETRVLYGISALAPLFDAVYEKLSK